MLLTVTEPRFYTHHTTTLALENLGEKRGIGCRTVWLDNFKGGVWGNDERITLAVFHAAHIKIARLAVADIKRWLPNAKIVTLGSDSIYYTRKYPDRHEGLLVDPRGYEFMRPEDVDLHLDLLSEVVEEMSKVCQADRWMWTASKAGLDLADAVASEKQHLLLPKAGNHVISYANPNVSAPGGYRRRLTHELAKRGRNIQWGGTTEFVTLDEEVLKGIYRLYRRHQVCLGTTSPSWTPCRTMKGWRDWFAPALGVPLIYDDHPDLKMECRAITERPPLFFFGYEDWDDLEMVLRVLDDEKEREGLAARQAKWARENTIERQFERLFDHYRLWQN